jgi:hypothetical protein
MLDRVPLVMDGFREGLVVKTYFGHAPAFLPPGPLPRARLRTSAGDRILLAGCAAVQYSGLTGCAFGPLVRNASRLAEAIHRALARNRLAFRDLCRIDIDPRERISQRLEGLFGGAMELDTAESPGTVNQDWIAFSDAAGEINPGLKNEAFRDKIRLETLHQLVRICAGRPGLIASVVRNNRGRLGLVVWTFCAAYATLLYHELRLLVCRRHRKYAVAGGRAVAVLPAFAVNVARFYANGRRAGIRVTRSGGKEP